MVIRLSCSSDVRLSASDSILGLLSCLTIRISHLAGWPEFFLATLYVSHLELVPALQPQDS